MNEKKDDIPEWEKYYKEEQYEKVLQFNDYYPMFKPEENKVYSAKITALPSLRDSKYGERYMIFLDIDGMTMKMYCNNSFLFSLGVERRRHGLLEEHLVNKTIVFKKRTVSKDGEDRYIYDVQLKV